MFNFQNIYCRNITCCNFLLNYHVKQSIEHRNTLDINFSSFTVNSWLQRVRKVDFSWKIFEQNTKSALSSELQKDEKNSKRFTFVKWIKSKLFSPAARRRRLRSVAAAASETAASLALSMSAQGARVRRGSGNLFGVIVVAIKHYFFQIF